MKMIRWKTRWFDFMLGGKDYGMQWGIGVAYGPNHKYKEGGDFIMQGESFWNHYAWLCIDLMAWWSIGNALRRLIRIGKYILLVVFSTTLIGCATVQHTPALDKTLSEPQMIQQISDTVGEKNFTGLAQWIHEHLPYSTDRVTADEWKDPIKTICDGTGDCEDLALVALAVLKRWGIQDNYLLGVFNKNRNLGHVVCIFRTSPMDNWQYYSNDDSFVHQGPAAFKDLPYQVAREMRYGSNIGWELADCNNQNIPPGEARTSRGLV